MPILNWVGKDSIVNHDKEVPFRLLKKIKTLSIGNSENIIIEGDNLETLKALLPYYQNKVKCIFIDPPYNTGNENWVYNDNVNSPKIKQWLGKTVSQEDLTRHDKWLCMIYPRLSLLRTLMRNDGIIYITIDDNEVHYLKIILDEIFGRQNFLINIIWQKKFSPQNDARFFSDMHDHILVYSKDITQCKVNLVERTELQNQRYHNPDNDHRGNWTSGDLSVKTYNVNYDYQIETPSGKLIWPPKGRCWQVSKEGFKALVKDNRIWFGENGNNVPRIKRFLTEVKKGIVPSSIWHHEEVGHNQEARQSLKKILPNTDIFDTPKPVKLIKKILQISTSTDDIVLDSFAGSGSTGQAVLELNNEDKKNRKFILIEMESKICREITSQRIKKVIEGYTSEGAKIAGTGGGFQYCSLSKPLFDKFGRIEETCTFEDLASYIYYTETRLIPDKKVMSGNFVGENLETQYYLIFREIGRNTLDTKFLKHLDRKGKKIIYADNCTVSEDDLERFNTIFKQIPYEVRRF
jgi:adenine specific DNA methylase Mod